MFHDKRGGGGGGYKGGRGGGGSYGGPKKFGGPRNSGGYKSFEHKELFDATCNSCGNSCQVPFRPTGVRPVYCRACFRKDGDDPTTMRFEGPRESRGPSAGAPSGNIEARLKSIEQKLDALIEAITGEDDEDDEDEEGEA